MMIILDITREFILLVLQVKFALLDERDIDLINYYAFEVRNM